MKIIILTLIIALTAISAHAQLSDWRNISSKNFVAKIIHDQSFLYVGTVTVDNNDVLWLNCRDPQYPDKMGAEFGLGLTRFDGST